MKTKTKNNKGFSLVELIIVITIMAVLTAILAPQFLKYVERSRVARDETNIEIVVRAVQTVMADEETYKAVAMPSGGKIDVSYASSLTSPPKGNIMVSILQPSANPAGAAKLAEELAEVLGGTYASGYIETDSPFVSQQYKNGIQLTVTFGDNHAVTFEWTAN